MMKRQSVLDDAGAQDHFLNPINTRRVPAHPHGPELPDAPDLPGGAAHSGRGAIEAPGSPDLGSRR